MTVSYIGYQTASRAITVIDGQTVEANFELVWEGVQGEEVIIDNVAFGSPAQKVGLAFDQKILMVRVPAAQPAKEWLWIPALAALALIASMQRRRRVRADALAAAAG